jgi:hypothetical protein
VAAPLHAVAATAGVYDDLSLDEAAAAADEAAAAERDALSLLGDAAPLAGVAPAAVLSRWQHVVTVGAQAVLRVPAAALQASPAGAWRCELDAGTAAAVFLLSAPALAHKVGAAEPPPAAVAAGRCLSVGLACRLDVPAAVSE